MTLADHIPVHPNWDPTLSEPIAAFKAIYDTFSVSKDGRLRITLIVPASDKYLTMDLTDNGALLLQILACRLPEDTYDDE